MGKLESNQNVLLFKHHSIISICTVASFFHIIMLIFNTLSPLGHKPVHSQCFWLGDKPCMHPFFHLLITRTKASSENHFWVDQTRNTPKGPIRTTRRMLQHLKVQIPEGAKSVDVHCHATMQHPLSSFLAILFKHLVPQNPTTGWPTGVGRFSKKKYSVDFQLEMDVFLQN